MSDRNAEPGAEDELAERSISYSRLLPYSAEQIFNAWADPQILAQWWGPKGFSNEFHHLEFRPGGIWKFTMVDEFGRRYENESHFVEIIPPIRIVYDHISSPKFRMTATLEPVEGGTRMSWHMFFVHAAECRIVRQVAERANPENFDRLEALLTGLSAGQPGAGNE